MTTRPSGRKRHTAAQCSASSVWNSGPAVCASQSLAQGPALRSKHVGSEIKVGCSTCREARQRNNGCRVHTGKPEDIPTDSPSQSTQNTANEARKHERSTKQEEQRVYLLSFVCHSATKSLPAAVYCIYPCFCSLIWLLMLLCLCVKTLPFRFF